MGELKIGDIVGRKSYGADILFKVVEIKESRGESIITLKGISYRIQADAPESDLILLDENNLNEHNTRMRTVVSKKCREIEAPLQRTNIKKYYYRDTPKDTSQSFARPGKVLHIDGDTDYLEYCIGQYQKFGMDVVGKFVQEKDQPSAVKKLLEEHRPDILVLTGHDGVIKGENSYLNASNYRNSKYFIEAVKQARKFEADLDSLVIFAGACQSLYNELIQAGANFASAPYRVLIHALDPVFVCQKIAFSGIDKVIEPNEIINSTITGEKGIGGLQTRGKYRKGFPQEPYHH